MSEKNLISSHFGTLVNFGKVPVERIIPEERYACRIGLTADNCMENKDFVDLYENIVEIGQQEPLHLVKKTETEFICIAGYRRTLALQHHRYKSNQDISAVAYVWEKDTPEDILLQVASFTNAKRKDLTILEKLNQFNMYRKAYPDTPKKQIAKDLCLTRTEVYTIEDFGNFYYDVQKFLGDLTNEEKTPRQYEIAKECLKFIEHDVIKIGIFDKLVRLTQEDLLHVRDIGVDILFVQLELFKLIMNDRFSFLLKKESKIKYLERLKNVGIDGIVKNSDTDEEHDYDEVQAPETDSIIPDMDDIIKEKKEMEKQLQADLEASEKELSEEEKELMGEVEKSIEYDESITDEDRAKVAIEAIYNSLVQIDFYELQEFFVEHANDLDLRKKSLLDKKYSYEDSEEFFTKLVDLLQIIKTPRGFIFDKALKSIVKENIKADKLLSKELDKFEEKKANIHDEFESRKVKIDEDTNHRINELKEQIRELPKDQKDQKNSLKALIQKIRMDSKQSHEDLEKEKKLLLDGLQVNN